MGTTSKGAPYPVGTDKVVDGDNAIKALADWINPLIAETPTGQALRAWVTSGGYTTNSQGGVAITVPFQTVIMGQANPQITSYGYSWNRASTGPPPGTVWFNLVDVTGRTFVANAFAVMDIIVMGY